MLEIIVIFVIAGKLRNVASSKGRSGWWAALGPLLWVIGEFTGAVVAAIIGMEGFALYGMALAGAGVGVVIAYVIVNSLAADPLWEDPVVQDGVPGGHYDPNNPYNPPRG